MTCSQVNLYAVQKSNRQNKNLIERLPCNDLFCVRPFIIIDAEILKFEFWGFTTFFWNSELKLKFQIETSNMKSKLRIYMLGTPHLFWW